MGKRKNLNGLPNDLVQSYFSSLMYYDKGYMPCWIWKKSRELGIQELEIDIFNKTTKPTEMQVKPILYYLDKLKLMVEKALSNNEFDHDFISNAKFKIRIDLEDTVLNQVSCQCILVDIKGRQYIGKIYKERAYPIADSLIEKIFNFAKNQ